MISKAVIQFCQTIQLVGGRALLVGGWVRDFVIGREISEIVDYDIEVYGIEATALRALLEKHGIEVVSALLFDRPTRLEGGEEGLENWIRMFRRELLAGLSDQEKQSVFAEVKAALRDKLFADGNWFADYRRLRIVAYKQ